MSEVTINTGAMFLPRMTTEFLPHMTTDSLFEIAPTDHRAKVQAQILLTVNQPLDGPGSNRVNAERVISWPKTPVPIFPLFSGFGTKPTHETSFGFAYVNVIGRPGFMRKPFAFLAGTIIVREKLPKLNASPDRLVVMVKHEREFNPKANGWEFLTVSGDGAKVLKRERNGGCLKCHVSASNNDFVFPEDGRYR